MHPSHKTGTHSQQRIDAILRMISEIETIERDTGIKPGVLHVAGAEEDLFEFGFDEFRALTHSLSFDTDPSTETLIEDENENELLLIIAKDV